MCVPAAPSHNTINVKNVYFVRRLRRRRRQTGTRGRAWTSRTIASDRERSRRWCATSRASLGRRRETMRERRRRVVVACVVAWVVACVARGVEATTETTGVLRILRQSSRRGDAAIGDGTRVLRVVWRERISACRRDGPTGASALVSAYRARRVNERTGRRWGFSDQYV